MQKFIFWYIFITQKRVSGRKCPCRGSNPRGFCPTGPQAPTTLYRTQNVHNSYLSSRFFQEVRFLPIWLLFYVVSHHKINWRLVGTKIEVPAQTLFFGSSSTSSSSGTGFPLAAPGKASFFFVSRVSALAWSENRSVCGWRSRHPNFQCVMENLKYTYGMLGRREGVDRWPNFSRTKGRAT